MKQLIQTNRKNQRAVFNRVISRTLKAGLLLMCFSFLMNVAQAQIIAIAYQNGPWSDPNTWVNNDMPTAIDDVIIGSDIVVQIDAVGAECNSLIIGGDGLGSGTIIFIGTSSLTVAGDITLGDASYTGTITMDTGATLTCNSIIEADPGYSGVYGTNTGTVVFNGIFTLPFNLFQFNNLVINSGYVSTGGRNLPIEGNLTVNDGATLDLKEQTANRNTIGGALTINNGATLKIGGGGTIPANFSNHIIGATSIIEYNGVAQTVATLNSSSNYGYLIISGSGLKEVNGTINIEKDLTVNGGIFSVNTFSADRTTSGGILTIANGATLRIAGTGTLPGSFSTHSIGATSTVEYMGAASQNVAELNSSQKYGNLTVTSGIKTLVGSIGVAGTLSFGGNPNKLVIGSNTLTLEGAISGSTTLRNITGSSSSNLVMTGALNRTLFFDATTIGTTNQLNNFTINHTGNTTTLGNDLVTNGNLTFTTGKLAISSKTLTVNGNLVNTVTGAITGSTLSKIIFNSSSVSPTLSMDQTSATTRTLSTLLINSTGQVVTMGNDLIMNSTITFTDGKLAINGNTLTLKGAVTNTVTGGLRSSSTSNLIMGGTVSATLSFDQTTPGTSNVINNVTLSGNQTITLGNALRLLGTHTPTAGVFASAGNYTIASTASKTANIAPGVIGGNYITGDVIIERFIPQNTYRAWRLLAAPANGKTINQTWQEGQGSAVNGKPGYGTNISSNSASWAANAFDYKTPGNSLLYYDQASNTLPGITNTSAVISNEPGYFMYIRGSRSITPDSVIINNNSSTTLRTTGTLNTGNQTAITIPADKSAVIGNPFASAIDVRSIGLTGGCIGASFYVWDPKLAGSYNLGAYQTLTDGGGGNYIVVPGGGSYGGNGSIQNTIESGAAFFTRAIAASGTITINEATKTTGSRMVFRPADASPGETLAANLFAKNNNVFTMADGNLVIFDPANNDAIDAFDAIKRTNFGENLSILKNGISLAVDKRLPIGSTDTIFLRMSYMKKIDYRLQLVANNLQHPNLAAFLEDTYKATSKPLNLIDTTYYAFTIDANAGSIAEKRFRIVFKPITVLPVSVTSIKATLQSKQIAVEWRVENQINIRHYEVEKSVNGRVFVKAATLVATGVNGSAVSYSWLDVNPAAVVNYYRIKSADFTGTFKYSAIVKVAIGKSVPAITVVPNLIDGNTMNLQFTSQPKGKYTMRLLSNNGQAVYSIQQTHSGGNDLQTVNLPASTPNGAYQLEIIAPDNSRQLQKLVIQRNK